MSFPFLCRIRAGGIAVVKRKSEGAVASDQSGVHEKAKPRNRACREWRSCASKPACADFSVNNIQSPLDDQSRAIQLQIILSEAFHFLGRWAVARLARGFGVKRRQLVASQLHRDPANAHNPFPPPWEVRGLFSSSPLISGRGGGSVFPHRFNPRRDPRNEGPLSLLSLFSFSQLSTLSPFSPSLVTPLPSPL